MVPAGLHEAHVALGAIVCAEALGDDSGEHQCCFPQLFDDARFPRHVGLSDPRGSSVLDPPFTLEGGGAELEKPEVALDSVPVRVMSSSQDGRIFLLAHFPAVGVPFDDEPVNVPLPNEVAIS